MQFTKTQRHNKKGKGNAASALPSGNITRGRMGKPVNV